MNTDRASSPALPLFEADLAHIVQHTEELWRELSGARLFITGGTGFFGVWLLETLTFIQHKLRQKHPLDIRAVILSRNPATFARKIPHLADNPAFTWLQGDLASFAEPGERFSHILHMGATSESRNPPEIMRNTVLEGTRRVLELAVKPDCERFLFISSGAAYGEQPPELDRISEDHLGKPNPLGSASVYGESKRLAEEMLLEAAEIKGFSGIIARCFAFIGPHLPLDAHYAAGNFLRDALQGSPIQIKGDGRTIRSYLYAADLIIWLIHLLVRGKSGQAYNVGSDSPVSILELAEKIRDETGKITGRKLPIQIEAKPNSGQDSALPPRYVPNVDRARLELGLAPLIDLPAAIQRTFHWLLQQKNTGN